jgi:electron transfer flavoprotein alpha subunit
MSGILIIAEQRRGELRPATLELVTAAQGVRRAGEKVTVALIGAAPQSLVPAVSVTGVDEIVTVQMPASEFEPDLMEAAVHALSEARKPSLVLVPHSIDAFGYAAAIAAKNGYGFSSDVFQIDYHADALIATRGGYGQKVNIEVEFPGRPITLLMIRSNVYKPPEGASSPSVSSLAVAAVPSRVRSLEFIEPPASDDVDMTAAEFILSIGRGIGEEANVQKFRELADKLGATLGCSRPIADAGWLPKSRQVGQSGKTASACKLYIAMGISGAIQHLAGMKHVSTIIAINSDAAASIFSVARYGVVGDIFELADALQEQS